MILEQLTKGKITEDEIASFDKTVGELIYESTYARVFSNELSEHLLKNSAKREAQERQKLEKLIERFTSVEVDRTGIKALCVGCTLF